MRSIIRVACVFTLIPNQAGNYCFFRPTFQPSPVRLIQLNYRVRHSYHLYGKLVYLFSHSAKSR